MIDRFREFCGRAPTDKKRVDETNVVEPPREISEARLEELLGASLRSLEDGARLQAERGRAVGRVVEVRSASGAVIDYRRVRYSSLLVAGCDARRAELENAEGIDSPRVREIVALWPFVVRLALMDSLGALEHFDPFENALRSPESRFPASEPGVLPPLQYGLPENPLGKAAEVRAIRTAQREAAIRRFQDRREAREAELHHTGFTDYGESVRIRGLLAAWDIENPELQAAIHARGGRA